MQKTACWRHLMSRCFAKADSVSSASFMIIVWFSGFTARFASVSRQ